MDEIMLITVKRNVSGLDPENTDFDDELLDHINSILRILNRYGIGKDKYMATAESTWRDFLGEEAEAYSECKTYVTLKIRYFWDPPTVGSAVTAIQETIKELEFDLMIRRECPDSFEE